MAKRIPASQEGLFHSEHFSKEGGMGLGEQSLPGH